MSSILPVYLFMAAYYLKGYRMKTVLSLLGPYLLCFIFYIFIWSHISLRQKFLGEGSAIPFGIYLATLAQLFGWYISKLVFPYHFLFLWDVRIAGEHVLARWAQLGFFMVFFASLYLILVQLKKRFEILSLTMFLAGFIPFCIAPFSYTSATHTALIEPHWFFFSSIGIFMLSASFLVSLGQHWKPWLKFVLLGGLIVSLVMMTRQSNLVWKNEQTYCKYWVRLNPLNGEPDAYLHVEDYSNRGSMYVKQGHLAQALTNYDKAIELDPSFADAYYNRGCVYDKLGRFTQALSDYSMAIALNPNYAYAYNNRGYIYSRLGNFPQAIADFTKAIELNPNIAGYYFNRGLSFSKQGNYLQAILDFTKTIEINPKHAQVYYNRAIAYYDQKEYGKAWADLSRAQQMGIAVDPQLFGSFKMRK